MNARDQIIRLVIAAAVTIIMSVFGIQIDGGINAARQDVYERGRAVKGASKTHRGQVGQLAGDAPEPMEESMNVLSGYKTIIASIGLAALGIYEITQGNLDQGLGHLGTALAAFGIRSAIK